MQELICTVKLQDKKVDVDERPARQGRHKNGKQKVKGEGVLGISVEGVYGHKSSPFVSTKV